MSGARIGGVDAETGSDRLDDGGGAGRQPDGGSLGGAAAPPGGERRRIVLMRHGSVDYFRDDGTPVSPDNVPLSELGRAQATAAGVLFAQCGVRFDRVVASGLPRTLETAALALEACGQQQLGVEIEPALQEIRGGRLSTIPRDRLVSAFLGAFGDDADEDSEEEGGGSIESKRFLGGESVGELLDRVLPAFLRLLERDDWHTLLLVLHGAVNRVLLSHALAGGRAFLGGLEQSPACINIVDVPPAGTPGGRMVVRTVNMAPTSWMHEGERQTTMERLLAQYMKGMAQR